MSTDLWNLYEEEGAAVKVDRSWHIDMVIDDFKKKRFVIPYSRDVKNQVEWMFDYFTAIQMELIESTSGATGYKRYTHPEGQPDDALHALVYARIACPKIALPEEIFERSWLGKPPERRIL